MNGFFDGFLHTFPLLGLLLASFRAIPGLTPVERSLGTAPDDSCFFWIRYGCSALRDPFLRGLRLGPELGDRYSVQTVVLDRGKSSGCGICIWLANGCGVEGGWSLGTNVAGSSYMTMTTMIEREVYGEFQNEASFYIEVLVFHLRHLLCSIYSQYPCRMTPFFLSRSYECMNESS